MKYPKLQGKRYINLVRSSTSPQAGTSSRGQLHRMNAFAEAHEMVHVTDIVLNGVTGSVPSLRADVDDLVSRKRSRNDFDVVLIYDLSRFTRSGAVHGFAMEAKLAQVGIRLVVVADDLPTGKFS